MGKMRIQNGSHIPVTMKDAHGVDALEMVESAH